MWRIRDLYWKIKYAYQRVMFGYDSRDVFEYFDNFIKRNIKLLEKFRKYHCARPLGMTSEEWDRILDTMVYHLKGMQDDYYKENEHKDEFFKLFSKYFYCLWY